MVVRPGSRSQYGDLGSREAYTTAADFLLRFKDRRYSASGTLVGSVIAPEATAAGSPPGRSYGTGGQMSAGVHTAAWSGTLSGSWASDRLELNDIGYLRNPDYVNGSWSIQYRREPRGATRRINSLLISQNTYLAWTYAGRTGYDINTGERSWSYGRGHRTLPYSTVSWQLQLRNFWSTHGSLAYQYEGTRRYDTRNSVVLQSGARVRIPGEGPLMTEPSSWTASLGVDSDYRKKAVYSLEGFHGRDRLANPTTTLAAGVIWNQTRSIRHSLNVREDWGTNDSQHIENYAGATGGGIGGVDYVYGTLRQRTLDLTLRSSILFSRSHSLEIYAQPFLTIGNYSRPRSLLRPDSYEFTPYSADGFEVKNNDYRYASVNLNAVYRWEYRPGSTLYLVWTQSRAAYDVRGFAGDQAQFDNRFNPRSLFRNEPENVFLAKVSFWFPV
jgi:hypothetical protein